MNKEQVLKELLERKQFWEYELENIEIENRNNERELRGAIAGIDVAILYIKEIDMDYETVIDIKSRPDHAMRDCLNCEDRTEHIAGRCAICGKN